MFSIAGKITKIYTVQKRLNIKVLVNYPQKQWVLKGNGKHSLVCPRPESDKKKVFVHPRHQRAFFFIV
ncbi:MAG: hypothetical protein GX159_03845 [Flavobacteriaceae bacterium]|jgi:hypothetical protein|nr:hypothetical protein [Flavobacteriaceae bacterium]